MNKRRVIALTGHPGSGKTSATQYLAEQYGLQPYSMGGYIRDRAAERNILLPTRPDGMRFFREVLRPEYGDNVLTDPIITGEYQDHHVVMDGLRLLHDLGRLRGETGKEETQGIDFWLVAIVAPEEDRYSHVVNDRTRVSKDTGDYQAFLSHTAAEAYNPDPLEPSVDQLIGLADITIRNTGSLEDLYASLDRTMALITPRPTSQQR